MTDYTKGQNFTAMAGGDGLPAVFDTEFNSVAAHSATKADKLNPTFSGTVVIPALSASASHAGDGLETSPAQSNEIYMHTFPTGTKMAFFQTLAPTGWTQDTGVQNNSMMRIMNGGTGGAEGGTDSPISALTTTDAFTLLEAHIPAHTHTVFAVADGNSTAPPALRPTAATDTGDVSTSSTGGGGSHAHAITFAPLYSDLIIATKD